MKTIIILTILTTCALTFLTSCRTGEWTTPPQPVRAKTSSQGVPQPYYRSNAEGRYYFSDGNVEKMNSNYRPTVKPTAR